MVMDSANQKRGCWRAKKQKRQNVIYVFFVVFSGVCVCFFCGVVVAKKHLIIINLQHFIVSRSVHPERPH